MSAESDARARLTRLLGDEAADALIAAVFAQLGIDDIATPDRLYRFASVLVSRGGTAEAIGRGLRVQALLQGASATPDSRA